MCCEKYRAFIASLKISLVRQGNKPISLFLSFLCINIKTSLSVLLIKMNFGCDNWDTITAIKKLTIASTNNILNVNFIMCDGI